ncbi:hypothetical protein FisN_18Lh207 [Fistulifera solaris]|uniref:Uncharacterized protein n=1 Tax=Fistulifera solaris TaxID=1519565 RepID=A0A1Z5JU61_FISSO|nr:hypothetical protein FisN_18Lh207 [Fistulifera solaris]|eukprot:GAX17557.1 hypothetical protein FisN_18Lh207 [Fistulifera solaris]
MQENYFESIHPPDLIHFDGRRTPESACSSLSSPGNSPLRRSHPDDVISPSTTRTVLLVPTGTQIALPFDEIRGQDVVIIDALSQRNEEEEGEEPGRIINCASPRSNASHKRIFDRQFEEKKSETLYPLDEKRQATESKTPAHPRDNEDFDDIALAPTDEKMSISLRNSRPKVPTFPDIIQHGVLDSIVSPNSKEGSFDDERFENPSFTPNKKEQEVTSTSMFQSLANATMSAALHIENLILGPSDAPVTPEQPSWYAGNKDTRDKIFSTIASPAHTNSIVDETPNTSQVWSEAFSSPDVWEAEQESMAKCNTSSAPQSPYESVDYTPAQGSAVVRRSFGAETRTAAVDEDAPADESGRVLSGSFQTPVSMNAPADELRTAQRRPIDPPPDVPKDAPGGNYKVDPPSERQNGNAISGIAVQSPIFEMGQTKSVLSHEEIDTKKMEEDKKKSTLTFMESDPSRDERRQDKNSPNRLSGNWDMPDDEPAALIPKKTPQLSETVRNDARNSLLEPPGTPGPILSPGKSHDEGEEPPELKRAVDSASPILHQPSPSAHRQTQRIIRAEDGYASDGTENLLGSLQVLMDDLDDMAQKRSIRTRGDQFTSFHSCISSVRDGVNASMLSTNGLGSPFKSIDALQDGLPFRINMLNNDLGIPIGDIIISLFNEENDDKPWTNLVSEAVWRCRIVRRNCDTKWLKGKLKRHRDSPCLEKSSSFAYSGDRQVLERTIQEVQATAIQHLKYDELSDAVYLYTEILDRYTSYIPALQSLPDSNHNLRHLGVYIGIAKYNLGIIAMLQGEFGIACGLFEKAATMLSHETSIDQLTIRSKIAICLIAQNELQKAQGILRAVCLLAREKTGSLPDRRQFAEILNNLACVNYFLNGYNEAYIAFTQSLDIQLSLCDDALYLGSKFSSQSSAMNVAVVRANVGFLALVSRDIPTARMAFESSLKALLLRDAHASLVSAMEHLAVIHLFDDARDKTLQLLRRVLHMQIDAFGADDHRCLLLRKKIRLIENDTLTDQLAIALGAIPRIEDGLKMVAERYQGGKTMASFWSLLSPESSHSQE